MESLFGLIKIYNKNMKDTLTVENVRFYNQSKLKRAQAVAGEDFEKMLEAYKNMAGKYDIVETATPEKKVVKKRAKKVSKKKSN